MVKTINGEVQLRAWVDGKEIVITESSVRIDLQLANEKCIDCLPNSTIFEQLALMGKPKRKDTQVPQPSGPTDPVKDEAVYKEWDDSLVMAATTTSSLGAEQDSDALDGEEVFVEQDIDADEDITLKRLQAEEQQELSAEEKAKLFQQLLEQRRKHFAAKITEEKRNKPLTQAQQRKIMCTYLKNIKGNKLKDLKNKSFDSIQKMFDRAFKKVNTFIDFRTELVEGSSKRAGEKLTHESTKKQKVEDDKETTDLKQLMKVILDEEEVAIDAIPLSVKPPKIIDCKIYKEGKKSYYQRIRVDGSSKMYLVFSQLLKSFHSEYLVELYKLVKDRYGSLRPVEDLDLLL
uniref:Uncharacterized protein n=1 Tax=Tanacetum cinerariifolium TaxID=118510 RepID=A0A699H581_TANCI|nr:hypothetical protein [Tanacetum cinerariifolium]